MPDSRNAHVRGEGRRQSPETEAGEAQRLLDDPAFKRGVERVRDGCIRQLEAIRHDGSEEVDDYERELCRTLRTLASLRRAIAHGVQGNQLRLAGYKPVPEKED